MNDKSKDNSTTQFEANSNHKPDELTSKNKPATPRDDESVDSSKAQEHVHLSRDKTAVDFDSNAASDEQKRRDLILTHREAEAGGPEDMAALGEEDIGIGLEFLVTRHEKDK